MCFLLASYIKFVSTIFTLIIFKYLSKHQYSFSRDILHFDHGTMSCAFSVQSLFLSEWLIFDSDIATDEHDSLRKRYADLVASHSAAVSKLELAQEEMTRLKKQYEESIQERNAAVRERNVLKQQCTQAIMQWDSAIRERNTYKEFLAKVQVQHEEEANKAMAVRIKTSKDLKRLTEERNAAMEEYSLVMRERDTVHKEIEKLQDDLSQSNKKLKTIEAKNNELNDEKKMLLYQVESLRREIMSALDDRDMALKVIS